MNRKDVRILLLGEDGVGKTSLILALVGEEFPEEVPAKAEEIMIPGDVTPEGVPTHIVDFSTAEQDDEALVEEIHRADVICIVYDVSDEETIERITSFWLPKIRMTLGDQHKTPVILVGNKGDLVEGYTMDQILPILDENREVETCVVCSAVNLENISEIFYYAQKAVLHPTAPIFSSNKLTKGCVQALTRIFKICDQDNDQILNDNELNHFQRVCFQAPLQPHALEKVKAEVRKNVPSGVDKNGLTLEGFLFLHDLFGQRGKHEVIWTVLRTFGYQDNLEISEHYLHPELHVGPGCTTELTRKGYQFLTALFEKYDEDKDKCLSPPELLRLFGTCPIMPWGPDVNNTVCTNTQGWITVEGYFAQWTLTTLLDVDRTLAFLAYLGYLYNTEKDNQLSAIHVTRDRELDLKKKQTSRNVFQCHVFGPKGVGKTVFLQGLLNRNLQYQATLNKEHLSAYTINTVPVYGQEKYLLLHEIDSSLGENLSSSELNCDVACLIYDVTNPKSFAYCAKLYKDHFLDGNIPCLVVGTKAIQTAVLQDHDLQPTKFCAKYKLPPPQLFDCFDNINKDVYVKLATMAAYPNFKDSMGSGSYWWLKAGLGIAVVAGVGFVVYKLVQKKMR